MTDTTRHLPLNLRIAALFVALIAAAPFTAYAQRATNPAADAVISMEGRFHPVVAENGMVAAQERLAAEIGAEILRGGGNAVDAGVAVGFAMAVTHPQAGNLGGGGFMVITLAEPKDGKTAIAIDYRERAPVAASRDMFLGASGDVDVEKARYSRAAAGVPGTPAGLLHALEKYGTLPRARVLAPAIRLAEEGFPISRDLAFALAKNHQRFAKDASSLRFFEHAEGRPYRVGEILKQPELAKVLREIADKGTAGFYEGWVADAIAGEMRDGGLITADDLKAYRVVEREPVRGTYRGYEVISMPPPSSGGAHLIQMLNVLEGYNLKQLGHNSADSIHLMVETMRRAYADRAKHMGDPDFYPVPVTWLTSKAYAAKLRADIGLTRAAKSADIAAGEPQNEGQQTTHFSVMDAKGNAVANTYTLNLAFGSGFSVDGAGFLLNNEMDDFSAKPGVANAYGLIGGDANAIAPGKRPLSSMTPTVVLKDGQPYLATGSPGGSTIITVVLQMLLNTIDFDMNVAEASAAPRIHHQWMPDNVVTEEGVSVDTLRLLEGRGFVIARKEGGGYQHRILGRTNSIMRKSSVFFGASDPRAADGAVAGF